MDTSTEYRPVGPVVPAKRRFNPAGIPVGPARAVGTVDIEGDGTDHVLEHADPIVMADVVNAPLGMKPPFCAHPHSGVGLAWR